MAVDSGPELTRSEPGPDIRTAECRRDVFFVARWWHHYFGAEYEHNYLPYPLCNALGWLTDDHEGGPLDYLVLVAEADDVLVGAGIATLDDHEYTAADFPPAGFDPDSLAGERNAWLMFSAVDPAWRGRGIGRRLFHRRLEWTAEIGADMTFGYGWERRVGPTSRPLFEANDFVPVKRFEGYYGSEHSTRDACPDCGVWPTDDADCRCDMTIWALDGDGGRDD